MKLKPNYTARLKDIERQYERLERRFADFLKILPQVNEECWPIKGITSVIADGRDYFEVSFATLRVGYRFMLKQPLEYGAIEAEVICTLERSWLKDKKPVLGSFSFDSLGRTNFEVGDFEDIIDTEQHAMAIISHFLILAIMYKQDDSGLSDKAGL